MTTEHDDSMGARQEPNARVLHLARWRDARLVRWAYRRGEELLPRDEFPRAVVDEIVEEALRAWRSFRRSVANPRAFISNRIETKGDLYRKTHGIDLAKDDGKLAPQILSFFRSGDADRLLGEDAREALWMLLDGRARSCDDVAAEMGVSLKYVDRLVEGALDRIRWWLLTRTPPRE